MSSATLLGFINAVYSKSFIPCPSSWHMNLPLVDETAFKNSRETPSQTIKPSWELQDKFHKFSGVFQGLQVIRL